LFVYFCDRVAYKVMPHLKAFRLVQLA